MVDPITMLRVTDGTLISSLVGNSYTVGKSATAGTEISKWLVLHPVNQSAVASAAGKGSLILKVEGSRQLAAIAGKTFTVGASPALGAEAGKWLVLQPSAAAVAAKSAAGAGAAAKTTMVLKVSGTNGGTQIASMAGKTYAVGQAPMTGAGVSKWMLLNPVGKGVGEKSVLIKLEAGRQLPMLTGKTFIIGKSPATMVGGSKLLVMHPAVGSAVTKGVAGTAIAAKTTTAGKTLSGGKGITAAWVQQPGAGAKGIAVVKAAAAKTATTTGALTAATKTTAASGTIWTGSGMSLGLGLGLGAMGPAILLAGLAGGAGYYWYTKRYGRSQAAAAEYGPRDGAPQDDLDAIFETGYR